MSQRSKEKKKKIGKKMKIIGKFQEIPDDFLEFRSKNGLNFLETISFLTNRNSEFFFFSKIFSNFFLQNHEILNPFSFLFFHFFTNDNYT